jgi:hypothetical protein
MSEHPDTRRWSIAMQAWHAEWAKKWNIDDFPYPGQSVEEWDARIPPEAEADYRRGVDAIEAALRTGPAPEPAAPTRPPLARTYYESKLFAEVAPCPRCGARRTAWSSGLTRLDDGELGERYHGDCAECGEHREYLFRLPEQDLFAPDGVEVFYGGPEPSQLLDPAQWLEMFEPLIGTIQADLAAGDTAAARRRAERAWVLVDEAMKFLPEDADAIPASAFFSAAGRERYEREPRRFTRRRLQMLHRMIRREFGAPAWAPPPPPLARSSAEAHLYLDLTPCVCGATRATWTSRLRGLETGAGSEYTATCPQCGRSRRYVFRQPPELSAPPVEGAGFSYGDGPASELIDPGQWLAESDRLSRSVPMLSPGAGAAERERFRAAIGRAAAALAEVARFAPPDADAVPEEACFTEAGRAVHRADPGRFRLDRLAAVRDSYLHLLEPAHD